MRLTRVSCALNNRAVYGAENYATSAVCSSYNEFGLFRLRIEYPIEHRLHFEITIILSVKLDFTAFGQCTYNHREKFDTTT